jgi:hypothetical protein
MITYEYSVDSCDTITSVSDEWLNFARENNTWELSEGKVVGKNLWSFVGNHETTTMYQIILNNIRTHQREVSLDFRCDSPTSRRTMRLKIFPGNEGAVHFQSLLLDEEKRKYVPLLDSRVGRASSFVIMCSWCNSVQTGEDQWEEIEDAVNRLALAYSPVLPKLAHGICPECLNRIRNEVQNTFKSDSAKMHNFEEVPTI